MPKEAWVLNPSHKIEMQAWVRQKKILFQAAAKM